MNEHTDNEKTLHITIGDSLKQMEAERDNITAALRGEADEIQGPRRKLNFHSVEQFHETFSPANVALLKVIRQGEPESIRELAEAVERDVSDVETDVRELRAYGLVELTEAGRPVLPYDRLEFDLSDDPADIASRPANA